MADITVHALDTAISLLKKYDAKVDETVREDEKAMDQFEDRLGTYLLKIAPNELQSRDSHTLSVLLHSIEDLERISDHAVHIADAAREINRKELAFSENATAELAVISGAVREIVALTMSAVKEEKPYLAESVEPLEEVIDDIGDEMKKRHITRLREGRCTMELGFVLSDLMISYKRIADHCSNISVCLIQAENNEFGRHDYLNSLEGNRKFREKFEMYSGRFALPESIGETV
jgi:phosphate:Na+ symporter